MEKIIFLDIDGVLNSNRYYVESHEAKKEIKRDVYGDAFDPYSEALLNKLIRETGANVVISSTWRGQGLTAMRQMWKDRFMEGKMVGITPFGSEAYVRLEKSHVKQDLTIPRGCEIQFYYENVYKFFHNMDNSPYMIEKKKMCTLSTYLILDDDQDMLYEQKDNFVQCDSMEGFTLREYTKAYKILMGNE